MKRKKFLLTLVLTGILVLLVCTSVKAVQSIPEVTTLKNTTASEFFRLIRQMETSSGPMGLNATVDNTGKETSASNNIDVHMAKNTEWGTAAMLASSVYGDAKSGRVDYGTEKTNGSATTGNKWGIYQMADGTYEYVAGIWNVKNNYNTNIYNADAKYKNVYTSESAISGDATIETKNWRGAGNANFVTSSNPVFLRSLSALFGYSYGNGGAYSSYGSRAAVVCGAGL